MNIPNRKPYHQEVHDWNIEYIKMTLTDIELVKKWLIQIDGNFLFGFDLKDKYLEHCEIDFEQIKGDLKERYIQALFKLKLKLRKQRREYFDRYGFFPDPKLLK